MFNFKTTIDNEHKIKSKVDSEHKLSATLENEHNLSANITNTHILLALNKDIHSFSIVSYDAPVVDYLHMYFKYCMDSSPIGIKALVRTRLSENKYISETLMGKVSGLIATRMNGFEVCSSSLIVKTLARTCTQPNITKLKSSEIRCVFGKFISFNSSVYKSLSTPLDTFMTTLTSMKSSYKSSTSFLHTRSISKVGCKDARYSFTTSMETELVHTTKNDWGKIARIMTSWGEVRDKFATWEDLKNFIKKEGES